MPDTKISDLTNGNPPQDADEFAIRRGAENRKLTFAQIKAAVPGAGNTEFADFAGLSAAFADLVEGRTYTVLAPVCTGGAAGTRWTKEGSLIRPCGRQLLFDLPSPVAGVSGGTTAPQILSAPRFDAGVLRGCRSIKLITRLGADGTEAINRNVPLRLGIGGTTADADIPSQVLSGAQRGFGNVTEFRPSSDTNIQCWRQTVAQSNANLLAPDVPFNSTSSLEGNLTDVTVPNLTTQQIYLTCGVTHGANPTSTITLLRYIIEVA